MFASTYPTRLESAYLIIALHEFEQQGGKVLCFPSCGLTVAMRPVFPGSKMAEVALAWCNANEPAFFDEIGQSVVMDNMECGETFMVRCSESGYEEWANMFADMHCY